MPYLQLPRMTSSPRDVGGTLWMLAITGAVICLVQAMVGSLEAVIFALPGIAIALEGLRARSGGASVGILARWRRRVPHIQIVLSCATLGLLLIHVLRE